MNIQRRTSKMGPERMPDEVRKRLVWQIRLSEQEHRDFLELARKRGTTAASLLRAWLQRELDKEARKG